MSAVTPLLRDRLHWLRVPQRVEFKRCLLLYKALHGPAPAYITEYCVNSDTNERRSRLRSSAQNRLMISRPSKTVRLRERSFSVNGPSLWNSLPDSVKNSTSVDVFKSRLKTYLFGFSFTSWPLVTYYMLKHPCFRYRPCLRRSINRRAIIIIIIIGIFVNNENKEIYHTKCIFSLTNNICSEDKTWQNKYIIRMHICIILELCRRYFLKKKICGPSKYLFWN